jgi:uridine kinase
MTSQQKTFLALLDFIQKNQKNTPFRVAINGIEGVGKTMFAENFVQFLQEQNIPAFHVSVDGFHHPKKIRYQQGRDSAKGYFEDSYDEEAFAKKVLKQSQEDFSFIPATHDLETDEYIFPEKNSVPSNAVLVTDGAYLFKEVYLPHWDAKIYLKASFEIARKRGAKRDAETLGGVEEAEKKFLARYHAASQMYIDQINPEEKADIIIDNSDFENPLILMK